MTQEHKELLLKALCARLPHKTYVKTENGIGYVYAINTSEPIELSVANDSEYWSEVFNIDKIKPYLRPMSSMTDEERSEYFDFRNQELQRVAFAEIGREIALAEISNWLNARHFDYLELIPLDLAIEVTKENNPYKGLKI